MNSYDQRQIQLMQDRIELFEQGDINRGELISDLRVLLDCLNEVEEEWKNNFYSEWFALEQVHAVSLDRGGIHKIENGEKFISDSLNSLKKLLNNANKRNTL